MRIFIDAKCSDLCTTTVVDNKGTEVFSHDGYVPYFMPGEHYGDYIRLEIDLKSGKILNWKVTEKAIKGWINAEKNRG